MIDKTYACLNEEGKLLISYLYKTNPKTRCISHYAPIYNINEVFALLNKYNVSLNEFDAAQWEMYEETGATKIKLFPIAVYKTSTFALLCYCEIEEMTELPKGFEIEKVLLSDTLHII